MNALADYYARRAPEYEQIYDKPERQSDLKALRCSVAAEFTGKRVLELACGTGWWTKVVAGEAASVLATDINEGVLALARRKSLPHERVSFLRADAFALSELKGFFNAALSAFWWSHLTRPELRRFLEGLHERLEPRSAVVFLDNVFVPGSSTAISRRDEDGNTYQVRTLPNGSIHEVLKNFPDDQQIAAALQGMREVQIQRLTYYWKVRYRTP